MYLNAMKRLSGIILTFLMMGILSNFAQAQNQQSAENSLLPEIDPQDIEIRSQFKARFPGLERQPILGFETAPRIHQIDPNRMPFIETPEQVVADLPVTSLSRPTPPSYTPLYYSSDINAFGRAGFGSYTSPELLFWGVKRLNSKSYVGGDLDYSSSAGHLDNMDTGFRFLNASGEFATKLGDKSRLDISAGLESSFNNMPDLIQATSVSDDAQKTYGGMHLNANYRNFKNNITGWTAGAEVRYFKASLVDAGSSFSGDSKEVFYNANVSKQWAGGNVDETFRIKAGLKGSNYENLAISSDNWMTAGGGLVYNRLLNYQTNIKADASVYYLNDAFGSSIYFGPAISVEHPLVEMLTITVKGSAKPEMNSIETLHSRNRFSNPSNILRHSYHIKGSAEAELAYSEIGSLRFGVQYASISDYQVFARNTSAGTPYFYEARYLDARKFRTYIGATHQLVPEKFWVTGKLYMQSPKIKDGGQLPYEEKVGVNSSFHLRLFDKLAIESWADYVGPRETLTGDKVDGFLLMGANADYQITERFGAYIKLVNLLNQDYQVWQGYTERPFQAFGGITVKL